MGRFSAFLLLFSISVLSFSQSEEVPSNLSTTSKQYALGITFGIGNLVMRDQVIANYLYSATYNPIGLSFEQRTDRKKKFITWEFMNSPNLVTKTNEGFEYKGDLGRFYSSDTLGYNFSTVKSKMNSLHYTSLYLLKKTESKRVKVFLGYELNVVHFNKKFLQFDYINQLTDRVYSLGFVLNLERNFSPKHHIEYNLSIPMLNLAKRTLFNSDASPNSISKQKLTSVGGVLGFDGRLTYRFQVSSTVSFRATYSFQYLQISFPDKEQWAYNQGVLGVFFHF